MNILNEIFLIELKKILDYVRMNEYDNFMECDEEILNSHVYKSVTIVESMLGDEIIDNDVAIRLLKTDLRDSVFCGNESDGYTNELDERSTGRDIMIGDECKLWIV